MKIVKLLNAIYSTFDVLTDPKTNPNVYKVRVLRCATQQTNRKCPRQYSAKQRKQFVIETDLRSILKQAVWMIKIEHRKRSKSAFKRLGLP